MSKEIVAAIDRSRPPLPLPPPLHWIFLIPIVTLPLSPCCTTARPPFLYVLSN